VKYVLLARLRDGAEAAQGLVECELGALRAAGHLVAAARLETAETLIMTGHDVPLVRPADDRLAAVFIIDARDLNDAVRVAGWLVGSGRYWSVEVRQAVEPAPGARGRAHP